MPLPDDECEQQWTERTRLQRYLEQLEAGVAKTSVQRGPDTHMVDNTAETIEFVKRTIAEFDALLANQSVRKPCA